MKRIGPVGWLISACMCAGLVMPGAMAVPTRRSGPQTAGSSNELVEKLEHERVVLTRRKADLDAQLVRLGAQSEEFRARQDAENAMRISAQLSQNALLAQRRALETERVAAQKQLKALSRAQEDWIGYLVKFEPISAHARAQPGAQASHRPALSLETKLVAQALVDVGQQAEIERRKIVQIDARIGVLNARYLALKPEDQVLQTPGGGPGAGHVSATRIDNEIASLTGQIAALDPQIRRVELALARARQKVSLERVGQAKGSDAGSAQDIAVASLAKTRATRASLTAPNLAQNSQTIRLIAPIAGPVRLRFGQRDGALLARGIGYGVAADRKVVAPASGKVVFADAFGSYGRLVMIDLGSQYVVALSGMAQTKVKTGEMVKSGDEIGWMSADPAKRGAELRLMLEFWHAGTVVDPSHFLGPGG